MFCIKNVCTSGITSHAYLLTEHTEAYSSSECTKILAELFTHWTNQTSILYSVISRWKKEVKLHVGCAFPISSLSVSHQSCTQVQSLCLPDHHKHTLFHLDTFFFFTSCYAKHWVFRLVTFTYEPSSLFQFHYLECESQWVMPDSRLLLLWCCSHFNSIDSRIGVVRRGTKEGREK